MFKLLTLYSLSWKGSLVIVVEYDIYNKKNDRLFHDVITYLTRKVVVKITLDFICQ